MSIWVQLIPLACITIVAAGQTCEDIICCMGKVCMEDATEDNGEIMASCVTPTSCDQLDCPRGFRCVNGFEGKVSCQASCENVTCPDFLQCIEQVSHTECAVPSDCLSVECPPGTSCRLMEIRKQRAALCLGDSCTSIDCFDANECINSTILEFTDKDASKTDISKNYTKSRRSISKSFSKSKSINKDSGLSISKILNKTSSRTDTSKSRSDSSGDGNGHEESFAICVPTCEEVICPEGLVCDEYDYQLVCRKPESCSELECPEGQECQEVACEDDCPRRMTKTKSKSKSKSKSKRMKRSKTVSVSKSKSKGTTGTKAKTHSKTYSDITTCRSVLVRCIDIDNSSTTEETPTTITVTTETDPPTTATTETDPPITTVTTETDPPVLERVGNEESALLATGTGCLATTTSAAAIAFSVSCVLSFIHM